MNRCKKKKKKKNNCFFESPFTFFLSIFLFRSFVEFFIVLPVVKIVQKIIDLDRYGNIQDNKNVQKIQFNGIAFMRCMGVSVWLDNEIVSVSVSCGI